MNSAQIFNVSSPIKIIAILIAVFISWLCYVYQITYPVCCDAASYLSLAEQYATHGLTVEPSGLRLYGYPLFVALNIKLATLISMQDGLVLSLVQTGLYLLGVSLVAKQIAVHFSNTIADVCFYALLANFFVYPYLSISLTDGLSVILLLFICYVILKIFSYPLPLLLNKITFLQYTLLGFLIGFAIMVRPANISWLLLLLPVIVTFSIHRRVVSWGRGVGMQIIAICLGFALAVTPQIYLNWVGFGRITMLPTYDLGGAQIKWGIANIKYATSMINGPAGVFYLNPYGHNVSGAISWYFDNPVSGIKTILLHIFSAFDFDYFFPYIYNFKNNYTFVLFLYCHTIIFWSSLGYLSIINTTKKSIIKNQNFSPISKILVTLYALLILGWLSVHALSAVENRFALPILEAMLPLAVWMLFVKVKKLKYTMLFFGLFFMYLLFAFQLTTYISSLKLG